MNQETANKYVEQDGTNCPYCGSYEIEGGDTNHECGHITQEIFCNACNAEWIDIYRLTGLYDKEQGRDYEIPLS